MGSHITDALKQVYKRCIRPVEETYKFDEFTSPLLEDSDFDAKPMVLLLGQYSVGKTTFVRYLLERDFPGQRIGPEPTTDRFTVIMHGDEDRVIPGNALAAQQNTPFRPLTKFGTGFLNKFECSQTPSRILESIYFVDTPGVLSGEKQRIGRSYDFVSAVEWFAERADIILLLFDAHKLDISDEFKRTIEALRGHDDKVRVVLNKADMISSQQLMRVYGALMWSLGKVFNTPEVVRVYIGSFMDREYMNKENEPLFRAEEADLLKDLRALPRNAAVRKTNELVKRARAAKVHAHIVSHLRAQMPSFFGKSSKKAKLMEGLMEEFRAVQRATQLPAGDFPNLHRFRERLEFVDISRLPKLNPRLLSIMDHALAEDIPAVLHRLGMEQQAGLGPQDAMRDSDVASSSSSSAAGAAVAASAAAAAAFVPRTAEETAYYSRLVRYYELHNPQKLASIPGILRAYAGREEELFRQLVERYGPEPPPPRVGGAAGGSAANPFVTSDEPSWLIDSATARHYDSLFQAAHPVNGQLPGDRAKDVLLRSKLPVETLGQVWTLADLNGDGQLDVQEFAIAMHLVHLASAGRELPKALPYDLIPPNRRAGRAAPPVPSAPPAAAVVPPGGGDGARDPVVAGGGSGVGGGGSGFGRQARGQTDDSVFPGTNITADSPFTM